MDQESGFNRCKLLHRELINNKVLLYSTENYIQHPGINHNGKEYEKECVCVCVCVYIYIYKYIIESLCCTAEINIVNQLYFNKTKKKNHSEWLTQWEKMTVQVYLVDTRWS